MVNNVITGTYTETYDLNTAVNELSMLAIHTPQSGALKRMFRGFFEQYRKFKIVSADFKMVCASKQELTPDLVGLEAGMIDPRDVLNPILFKACTGESINLLVDQIYNDTNMIQGSSIGQSLDTRTVSQNAYYNLLSDDSWRKSHPQSGLTVMGLHPMVHRVVTTQPFKWFGNGTGGAGSLNSSAPYISGAASATGSSSAVGFGGPSEDKTDEDPNSLATANPSVFISNGLAPMPWMETTVDKLDKVVTNVASAPIGRLCKSTIAKVPRVYMGVLILPPAILQSLYFRMQIRWTVQFKDFRPAYEVGPLNGNDVKGVCSNDDDEIFGMGTPHSTGNFNTTYQELYHTPTTKEVNAASPLKEYSSFETNSSAEVDQIMEKVQ